MKSRKELVETPEYWMEKIQNEIFRAVYDYMEQNDFNQSRLAQDFGVSKGYISQILNGNFNFSLKKLIGLSLALGLAPALNFEKLADFHLKDETRKLNGKIMWPGSSTVTIPTGMPSDEYLDETPSYYGANRHVA